MLVVVTKAKLTNCVECGNFAAVLEGNEGKCFACKHHKNLPSPADTLARKMRARRVKAAAVAA